MIRENRPESVHGILISHGGCKMCSDSGGASVIFVLCMLTYQLHSPPSIFFGLLEDCVDDDGMVFTASGK